jgi:hypothetical protein
LRLWNLDLRWSLLQKQVVWPIDISSYLFPFFGTVVVDRGLKFYSFIRFAYVQDQATYSLYLFLYHIVKFRSTSFPLFQQNYKDIFLIDCLLFKINSVVSHMEQTLLFFYSPGVPKMGWVSVIMNVIYSLTDVYVYVTQSFNHLCIIPCFLVFSKVVAIFSKRRPTCLTWSC